MCTSLCLCIICDINILLQTPSTDSETHLLPERCDVTAVNHPPVSHNGAQHSMDSTPLQAVNQENSILVSYNVDPVCSSNVTNAKTSTVAVHNAAHSSIDDPE